MTYLYFVINAVTNIAEKLIIRVAKIKGDML